MINNKYLETIINSFSKIKILENAINKACKICINAINRNNKIFFCGNGGSAADSEHLAAELIGKFLKKRKSLPSIALTANSSIITSISNDLSFDEIFSRQIDSLANPGDVLFAISTSGKSNNVINAIKIAKKKKMKIIMLTSIKSNIKDSRFIHTIKVENKRTDRIQEQHIAIGHIICEAIENSVC